MEFIRVDANTIRCVLTEDDLNAHGVHMSDFLENNDSARELIDYLLAKSMEELNYKKSGEMISINIVPLPENSVALTFTDASNELKQVLKQLVDLAHKLNVDKGPSPEYTKKSMALDKEIKKLLAKYTGKLTNKQGFSFDYLAFRFNNINEVLKYSRAINIRKEAFVALSSLYRIDDGGYYLTINRGAMDQSRFQYMGVSALEYASLETAFEPTEYWIKEHCKPVIMDNAIEVLRLVGEK